VPAWGLPGRELGGALEANRAAAAAAALLTLPPRFSSAAFRAALVRLSYGGDVRAAVGAEDASKVARIAAGAGAELEAAYARHLGGAVGAAAGLVPVPSIGGPGAWAQDPGPAARGALAACLPPALGARIAESAGGGGGGAPDAAAAVARAAAGRGGSAAVARLVGGALAATVRASSTRAALAGLIASGPVVAAWYVAGKVGRAGRARPVVG
jgi:hypothetical protein